MITFFTTLRLYTVAEENAVNSWLALSNAAEVIIFSENPKLAETIKDDRVTIISEFKTHESGLPLLNNLFQKASQRSRFSTLCYCNSDIILLPAFQETIQVLLQCAKPYLAVSQRIDVDIDFNVTLSNSVSFARLKSVIAENGKIHPPYGSDIFVFPKGQYSETNMPDLVVGRPGWDLWMLYDARRRFNRLINLTGGAPVVIHQNHPQKYRFENVEDQMNLAFLPKKYIFTFILSYCNFHIQNGNLRKTKLSDTSIRRLRWELIFSKGQLSYYYFLFFLLIKKMRIRVNRLFD